MGLLDHLIQRTITDDETIRYGGEVVDSSSYRDIRQLKNGGWLEDVPPGANITKCGCGRRWAHVESVEASKHVADCKVKKNAANVVGQSSKKKASKKSTSKKKTKTEPTPEGAAVKA